MDITPTPSTPPPQGDSRYVLFAKIKEILVAEGERLSRQSCPIPWALSERDEEIRAVQLSDALESLIRIKREVAESIKDCL